MAAELPEIARRLAEAGRRFDARGWVSGTSGNFSAVITRDPLRLAITASGAWKGDLIAAEILELDADGHAAPAGWPRPWPKRACISRSSAFAAPVQSCIRTRSGARSSPIAAPDGGLTIDRLRNAEGPRGRERRTSTASRSRFSRTTRTWCGWPAGSGSTLGCHFRRATHSCLRPPRVVHFGDNAVRRPGATSRLSSSCSKRRAGADRAGSRQQAVGGGAGKNSRQTTPHHRAGAIRTFLGTSMGSLPSGERPIAPTVPTPTRSVVLETYGREIGRPPEPGRLSHGR